MQKVQSWHLSEAPAGSSTEIYSTSWHIGFRCASHKASQIIWLITRRIEYRGYGTKPDQIACVSEHKCNDKLGLYDSYMFHRKCHLLDNESSSRPRSISSTWLRSLSFCKPSQPSNILWPVWSKYRRLCLNLGSRMQAKSLPVLISLHAAIVGLGGGRTVGESREEGVL